MGNDKNVVRKLQNLDLYEYQARDKFFRTVRGRVEAASKSGAKKIVKSKGYYLPTIWPNGEEPLRVAGIDEKGYIPEDHSPELKLKLEDDHHLIYATRNLPRYILGMAFIIMAIGLTIYGYAQKMDFSGSLLVYGIAMIFGVAGTLILFRYIELKVDRLKRQVAIRMRIVPCTWREEQIDGKDAEKVILEREIIYTSSRSTVYFVGLVVAGERIHLDASSDKDGELALAEKVAEYLGIPFVDKT